MSTFGIGKSSLIVAGAIRRRHEIPPNYLGWHHALDRETGSLALLAAALSWVSTTLCKESQS